MRKSLFYFYLMSAIYLLPCNFLMGQDEDLSILNISPELLKEAKAVIRYDHRKFERKDLKNARLQRKYAISILDPDYLTLASLYISYDKYSKVKQIDASIYNAEGKRIKKIKSHDFSDYPFYEDFTLYSDNRLKYYKPESSEFPVTFVFEYEVDYEALISVPNWVPGIYPLTSVEQSSFTYKTPVDFTFEYLERNYKGIHKESIENGRLVHFWEVANLPSWEPNDYLIPVYDRLINIHYSPGKIWMDNYEGSTKSWHDLGNWVYQLNKGRNELSISKHSFIKQKLKGINSDIEKARVLYEHLQESTRYVSIQLGIGGFQPFPASKVESTEYGDCKALSNYMKAMLDAAGIKSHYAIIGTDDISSMRFGEFSNINQANHAILCLPNQGDTVWLECTNQYAPFGFLGDFTAGKNALLIQKNKSRLVKTKNYLDSTSQIISNYSIDLTNDMFNPKVELERIYSGDNYYKGYSYLMAKESENHESLARELGLNMPKINALSLEDEKSKLLPVLKLKVDLNLAHYSMKAGNRMIIPVSPETLTLPHPHEESLEHEHAFYNDKTFKRIIHVKFQIPAHYTVEYIPQEKELSSEFGTFTIKTDLNKPGQLNVSVELEIKKGQYEITKLKAFNNFIEMCEKQLNKKIVLKK